MPSTIQPTSQYTFGPANNAGDIVHFTNTAGQVVSWIDSFGVHWGGLGTIALVSLAGQTASIGSTPLYAVPPTGGGMYAVYADVIVTSAGSAGTVVASISWNNGTTAAGLDSVAFNLNTQGEQAALLGNFMAAANSIITYFTTVSGASGNPQYNFNLR